MFKAVEIFKAEGIHLTKEIFKAVEMNFLRVGVGIKT
jgi:hypothetical protein